MMPVTASGAAGFAIDASDPGVASMKPVIAVALALVVTSQAAFGQSTTATPAPAKALAATAAQGAASVPAAAQPAKPAASTPASRSASALALSDEPIFDQGTAERIKQAALSYGDIKVRGGWPTIPTEAKFALGVAGPHDDLLRRRLTISGDLATEKMSGPFDDTVVAAVKHFQLRHGLAATGTLTPRTLAALNVPVAKRIQQLEASLERLANMPFAFGPRYVVVNIPATYAEAVENDKVVRRYRVIVGKTEKPSPTLTAEITNVNLNPTWTVPASIAKNEIVAHMRKDPGYLARMHMQLLDAHDGVIDPASVDWATLKDPNFTVRQESGSWNALGSVRIDMPNSYSVYMHDTNQKNLFTDDYRFDSHGCARVDNVRDLAAWLLRDMPQWGRPEIDAAIATGQRTDIHLPKKVPVAWVYLTGWMSRDQTIQFRNDIYDQDAQLLEATAEEAAFFNQATAPAAERRKMD
jgi:murein L,D-transpeptidase YcbB/YkuD